MGVLSKIRISGAKGRKARVNQLAPAIKIIRKEAKPFASKLSSVNIRQTKIENNAILKMNCENQK